MASRRSIRQLPFVFTPAFALARFSPAFALAGVTVAGFALAGCSDSFHQDRSGYIPKVKAHVFEVPSLKLLWDGDCGVRVNQDIRQVFHGPQSSSAIPANSGPYFIAMSDESTFSYLRLTDANRISECEPGEIARLPVAVPGMSAQFFLDQVFVHFQGKVVSHFKLPEKSPVQSKVPGLQYIFTNNDRSMVVYRPNTHDSGLFYIDNVGDPKPFHLPGLGNIMRVFEPKQGVCTILMCKRNESYGRNYFISIFDPHASSPLQMLTLLNDFEESLDTQVLFCPEANRVLFLRQGGTVRVLNTETGQTKELSPDDLGRRPESTDIALLPGTPFLLCDGTLYDLWQMKVIGKVPQFSAKKPFAVALMEPPFEPKPILYYNSPRGEKDVKSLENTRICGFDLRKLEVEKRIDLSGPWDQRGNEPVFLPEVKKMFFVAPNKLVVFSGDSTRYLVQE